MKLELANYELSKLAEKHNFRWETKTFFYSDKTEGEIGHLQDYADICRLDKNYVLRPSLELLSKWLRDVHNVFIDISNFNKNEFTCYIEYTADTWRSDVEVEGKYDSYEECLEEGLFKACELI